MKIIHEDQSSMVAKHRPFAEIYGGLAFAAIGIFFYAVLTMIPAKSSQASADGPPGWVFLIFTVIGLLILLNATFITVRLDKNTQQGVTARRKIIGRRSEEFPLSAVKEMRHEKTVDHFRKGRMKQVSRIAFVLNDGRHIEVKFPGRGFRGSDIGARMAAFLGVPFTDIRPPTMREAFANMRGALKDAIEKKKQSGGKGGGENMPPPILK